MVETYLKSLFKYVYEKLKSYEKVKVFMKSFRTKTLEEVFRQKYLGKSVFLIKRI